jgi:hypothetical protein
MFFRILGVNFVNFVHDRTRPEPKKPRIFHDFIGGARKVPNRTPIRSQAGAI